MKKFIPLLLGAPFATVQLSQITHKLRVDSAQSEGGYQVARIGSRYSISGYGVDTTEIHRETQTQALSHQELVFGTIGANQYVPTAGFR